MTVERAGSGHDGGRPLCGADKRGGGTCTLAAGWGTPHPGIGRCKLHGGSTPSHVANAQNVQADAVIRKLWPGLADASPVKDPVGQMEQLAGALTQMLDVVGEKVNDLEHYAGGAGLTQLRGELVLLDKVAGQLRQLLEAMARLGIAERHIVLEQQRADVIVGAFRAALAAVALLPADEQAMLSTFLDRLGDVVPGEVVA